MSLRAGSQLWHCPCICCLTSSRRCNSGTWIPISDDFKFLVTELKRRINRISFHVLMAIRLIDSWTQSGTFVWLAYPRRMPFPRGTCHNPTAVVAFAQTLKESVAMKALSKLRLEARLQGNNADRSLLKIAGSCRRGPIRGFSSRPG